MLSQFAALGEVPSRRRTDLQRDGHHVDNGSCENFVEEPYTVSNESKQQDNHVAMSSDSSPQMEKRSFESLWNDETSSQKTPKPKATRSHSTPPGSSMNGKPGLITPPTTPIDHYLRGEFRSTTKSTELRQAMAQQYLRPMTDLDMFHAAEHSSDIFAYQKPSLQDSNTEERLQSSRGSTSPSTPERWSVTDFPPGFGYEHLATSTHKELSRQPQTDLSSPPQTVNAAQKWGAVPSRYLQVGNLPTHISLGDVKGVFQKYGDLKGLFVKMLRSHGIVVVAFFDMRDSVKTLRQLRHQMHFQHRRLDAQFCSRSALIQMFGDSNMPLVSVNEGELMISMLGNERLNQGALQALLAAYGDLRGFRVVGINSSKLVLVEYFDLRDAAAAKDELNGQFFEGTALHISFHEPDAVSWQAVSQVLQLRQDELSILNHFRTISQEPPSDSDVAEVYRQNHGEGHHFSAAPPASKMNSHAYQSQPSQYLTPGHPLIRRGSTGSVILQEAEAQVTSSMVNPKSRLLRHLESGRRASNIYGADEYSVQRSTLSVDQGNTFGEDAFAYRDYPFIHPEVVRHSDMTPEFRSAEQGQPASRSYGYGSTMPQIHTTDCSLDSSVDELQNSHSIIICDDQFNHNRNKLDLDDMKRRLAEQQDNFFISMYRQSESERNEPRAPLHKTARNHEKNKIDLDRVTRGIDTRTTIMIKNVPNKYTQQMLMEYIDATHPNRYDFFYLRIDFQNRCNVGYAFVNFIDPIDLVTFAQKRVGTRWNRFHSDKICDISYANIQGKEALIDRFRNSSVMDEDPSYRPKIFSSSGSLQGQEEAFPASNDLKRKLRSIASAQTVGLFPPQSGRRVWHRRDTDDEEDGNSSAVSRHPESSSERSPSRGFSTSGSEI